MTKKITVAEHEEWNRLLAETRQIVARMNVIMEKADKRNRVVVRFDPHPQPDAVQLLPAEDDGLDFLQPYRRPNGERIGSERQENDK
jgi:hypothetical protein